MKRVDIVSRIFNKKYINYAIVFISIIYYIYLMFFSNVTLGTGKKELENMIMLIIPCFMLLFYSDSDNHTKIDIYYQKRAKNLIKLYRCLL